MACEICGRGSCSRSFHSFEAQEKFYYRPKDLDAALARVAELAEAFNKVCAENADFVAESIKDETRIAELEARLKHCEGHAAELEAEVKMLRLDGERYRWLRKNGGFFAPTLRRHLVYTDGDWDYDAAIDAAMEEK